MTALVDTLFQLEKYLGLELDSLLPFASADEIGGYHPDPDQRKWGSGAIWDVEGRTIYALVRALKPLNVVEIGSGTGCSTTHIAFALNQNQAGHVRTIDRGNTPQVPFDLKNYVTIMNGDAIEFLESQLDNSIDFILEDADHSEAMCYEVGELAKTKLRPGGVLMAHDAVHQTVGADVRAGYDRAGLDLRTYLTDPSDCGWAVWRRPNLSVEEKLHAPNIHMESDYYDLMRGVMHDNIEPDLSPIVDTTVLQAQEDQRPAKVKRARKAKAKAKK